MLNTDPDKAAEETASEERKKVLADGAEGRLAANPKRKNLQNVSIQPRNQIERIYYEKFGSVAPIPHKTLRRSDPYRLAAILHIHHNVPITRCAEYIGIERERLKAVSINDNWTGMIHTLVQLSNVSKLTVIPTHNLTDVEGELERRKAKNDQLIEKENELIQELKACESGSKQESNILSNIKKIRDMLEQTTGLGDYLKEISSARGAALKLTVEEETKKKLGREPGDNAKPSKGKVLDL